MAKNIDKLQNLFRLAKKNSDTSKILETAGEALGETFNSLSALEKRITQFDPSHDSTLMGQLSNALKPLAREPKKKNYSGFSKAPTLPETGIC